MPTELCIWSQALGSSETSQTQMVLPDTFGNRPIATYGDRKAIKMFHEKTKPDGKETAAFVLLAIHELETPLWLQLFYKTVVHNSFIFFSFFFSFTPIH